MNARGAGPTRELHGVDLIRLVAQLNYSRIAPIPQAFDFLPGFSEIVKPASVGTNWTTIQRFYPGIRQKEAQYWAAVGMEFDPINLEGTFANSKLKLHFPDKCQWAPTTFADNLDYWPVVVTNDLVRDPFTGLLDVPKINWLPEY